MRALGLSARLVTSLAAPPLRLACLTLPCALTVASAALSRLGNSLVPTSSPPPPSRSTSSHHSCARRRPRANASRQRPCANTLTPAPSCQRPWCSGGNQGGARAVLGRYSGSARAMLGRCSGSARAVVRRCANCAQTMLNQCSEHCSSVISEPGGGAPGEALVKICVIYVF